MNMFLIYFVYEHIRQVLATDSHTRCSRRRGTHRFAINTLCCLFRIREHPKCKPQQRGGHVGVEHTYSTLTLCALDFGYERIHQVLATATRGGHVSVERTYLQ